MLKVNFLQNELAQSKRESLRTGLIAAYGAMWIIAGMLLFLKLVNVQDNINTYQVQIAGIKKKIDVSSPQFKKAVELHQQQKQYSMQLKNSYHNAVEFSFIRESLTALTETIPGNFWLKEIHFVTVDSQNPDDNDYTGPDKKVMMVKGNLFLDLKNQDDSQIQKFLTATQKARPFSFASTRVDLQGLTVAQQRQQYYHNFMLEFSWDDLIL